MRLNCAFKPSPGTGVHDKKRMLGHKRGIHALDEGNFGLARKLLTGHGPQPGQQNLRGLSGVICGAKPGESNLKHLWGTRTM